MRLANRHLGMILGLLLGLGSAVGTGWAQTAGVTITPYQILTLSGDAVGPTRINNGGVVALYGRGAFLLRNRELSRVSLPVDTSAVYPLGLNESGDIVGEYFDPVGFAHAFSIVLGSFQSLSAPGLRRLTPYDINQQRVIVGLADAQGEAYVKAFVLKGGEYTFFRCPGVVGHTEALGINRNGDIAGTCGIFPDQVGFVYRDGAFTFINYPGATSTRVFDINASGDLVGSARLGSGDSVPFLYRNGVFQDLSFPGLRGPDVTATVLAINDLGVAVGEVFIVQDVGFSQFFFILDTSGLE